MTIEDAVFDYLGAAISAAPNGTALYQAELHGTVYEKIKKNFGVRVGDCESDVAPLAGGGAAEEFDASLIVVIFARVEGADKSARRPARNKAREMMLAVAKLFQDDPSMGGRVRDSLVGRCARGFDSLTNADEYAVVNMPLLVNMSGHQLDAESRGWR